MDNHKAAAISVRGAASGTSPQTDAQQTEASEDGERVALRTDGVGEMRHETKACCTTARSTTLIDSC
eukprot:CAMPEP_0119392070 /NCGR_PEP_ID=MMETSP1334-20130426/119746_1 /TAXON_ID=127549 /ORGANISM="Calcidiscus leptoporus, Strain RCC1130" /LENGTH=66 /DNA_ID=CAMNT_0007414867 /DNA_START=120 /DNA_END=321 /DNA_ORIENTATION=-